MALISCPECEKQVSSRAHSCPFCGFPLDEYFEEIEQEKAEKEEAVRLAAYKQKMSFIHEFDFMGTAFCITDKDKLCAQICEKYEHVALALLSLLMMTIKDKNKSCN